MKVYDITLDFEDGTADGCHFQSNGHIEKGAIEFVQRYAQEPYFEFSDDAETKGEIWANEAAARTKGTEPIGKFVVRDIAS